MDLLDIILLSIVQGITEFLPVSSSAHLRTASELLGIHASTLGFDVAVHIGTLGAVVIYFRGDLARIAVGTTKFMRGARTEEGFLGINLIIATIPVYFVGFFLRDYIESDLRLIEVIGWTSIVFGILLWWADRYCMTILTLKHLNYRKAFIIGIFQVFALIPGSSRAGVTITAARMLGYERIEAARFSMLLSIPAIAGAGTLVFFDFFSDGNAVVWRSALLAVILSFITATLAISLLMRWLKYSGFAPFVIYRILFGTLILSYAYSF